MAKKSILAFASKKADNAPAGKKPEAPAAKRPNRVVRYFREVKAELQKVVWPSRRATLKLTGIVLAVTGSMSVALGLVDWIFTKLFALIVG